MSDNLAKTLWGIMFLVAAFLFAKIGWTGCGITSFIISIVVVLNSKSRG